MTKSIPRIDPPKTDLQNAEVMETSGISITLMGSAEKMLDELPGRVYQHSQHSTGMQERMFDEDHADLTAALVGAKSRADAVVVPAREHELIQYPSRLYRRKGLSPSA